MSHPVTDEFGFPLKASQVRGGRRQGSAPVADEEIEAFLAAHAERHPIKSKPEDKPCS